MRRRSKVKGIILDLAYKGEVFFSRMQGIAFNNPRANGEYRLIRAFRTNIKLAVDAGSNLGDWTAEVLKQKNGKCHVACIEPDPANAQFLTQRFSNNSNVQIYEAAVCDMVGTARFRRGDGQGSGVGHLVDGTEGQTVEVRTITLNWLAQEYADRELDLVKADIEGAEIAMLRGAEPLFRRKRIGVMQLEYNSTWIAFGRTLRELFDFAGDHSYAVLAATPFGLTYLPSYALGLEDYRMRNLILAREDCLDVLKPVGPSGRARVEAATNR